MHLKKQVVASIPVPYSVNFFHLEGKGFICAGSEVQQPLYLIELDSQEKIKIVDGPGGTMSISPVSENNNDLISIMGMFPPFIGREAGVYIHSEKTGTWESKKIINLPFAHRCEIVDNNGKNFLFLSSVSKFKENPEDWSLPGELYVIPLQGSNSIDSLPDPLIDNIYRNHGMTRTVIDGRENICISGSEGIFSICSNDESLWTINKIFDKEVSEFSFFDVDNDGIDELITIESFHGNSLNIYHKTALGWNPRFRSQLSFGHGLSVNMFNGFPSIVVGNRRGDKALYLFSIHWPEKGIITKTVIEKNAGPTQTKIFNYKSKDYILSSNQDLNEIALYSL